VRALLASSFLLTTGTMLQAAALGKQVFDVTGRELDIGLLGLAEFLPAAVLVLVTGTVADRFDRRAVAALAMAGELACAAALVVYARSEPTEVWPVFVIAVAFGSSRAFLAPATRAIPPMIAPNGGLARIVALYAATWTAAMIVGPAVSGVLYSIDPWVAYATTAVLILISMALLVPIRYLHPPARRDPDDRPTLHSALEGLRFIRRTPLLLAAISLDLFAVLFGGAVALLPVIAEERLGVGDVAYGWLRAAPGIGAAGMALLLTVAPVQRHVGRRLLVVVGIFGAATVVLGVTTSYVVAFATLIVLAAADMISVFIRSTLVPLVTPDDKRGRVLAVENVFIGASNELGAFESGVAAQAFGTQVAVVGGGLATMGIVGIWWFRFTELRDVDRFSELSPLG
jgi:MFS family permease